MLASSAFGSVQLRAALDPPSSQPITAMPKRIRHPDRLPRQILGVSLPPEVAAAVKAEAAKRDITMRDLFLELWQAYQAKTK